MKSKYTQNSKSKQKQTKNDYYYYGVREKPERKMKKGFEKVS